MFQKMDIKILTLLLVFCSLGASHAQAGEKIWVGLYYAENNQPAAGKEMAPKALEHRLNAVFGFNYYEQVSSQSIELENEWQQWAVPRNDFFIRVEPLARKDGEPKVVYYEIYKDGFIVAKGKYEPHPDTPLFINGPDFKQGRFIFVLEAR
jgi:hypothetical protein